MSDLYFTQNSPMKKVLNQLIQVAPSKAPLLIFGESGTGKELLAQALHFHSHRKNKNFIAINCAALPENLLESELFGYERGAFTGADQRKIGQFELAHEGTLFLDEIGELPMKLQAKLLRVLQEGQIIRIGGDRIINVNVRIVSATNKNLFYLIKKNEFREDLFYRLNVVPLNIPALRDRKEDIVLLANKFISQSLEENKIQTKVIQNSFYEKLIQWNWPGNVRELKNVIERALLMSEKNTLTDLDVIFDYFENSNAKEHINIGVPGLTVQEAEKKLILKTLEFTSQNRSKAADLLGISVRTLRNKMHLYSKEG